MPDSPQVAVVHAWLDHAKTIDVDEIEKLTTDTFAVDCIDENGTVHKFTKSQIFHHIRQQVKPYHKTIDILKRDITQPKIEEVLLESEAVLQPVGHHVVFTAPYTFVGEKVEFITVNAKAVDYKVLRFDHRSDPEV